MRDVLRSLGASKLEILWKIGVPRSMPYLFASLKVAITLAFIGSVIAETVGGNNGIGYVMIRGASDYRTDLVFAGLIIIAAMGIAMYGICAWFERRMTGWAVRGAFST
jgi:NitT/TauT family transport system permease protein